MGQYQEKTWSITMGIAGATMVSMLFFATSMTIGDGIKAEYHFIIAALLNALIVVISQIRKKQAILILVISIGLLASTALILNRAFPTRNAIYHILLFQLVISGSYSVFVLAVYKLVRKYEDQASGITVRVLNIAGCIAPCVFTALSILAEIYNLTHLVVFKP